MSGQPYLRSLRFTNPDEFSAIHPANCQRQHTYFVMGVYDRHGMRLNKYTSVICHDDPDAIDLNEAAKANAAYWPGNHVYLWRDLSLTPTEHLRHMPEPDASA